MSLEYITSKNLFLLICETLRLIDEQVVDHGGRVGYILVQMLKTKGGYEQFSYVNPDGHRIHKYEYDKERGIYLEVLVNFIMKTQPKQWARYTKYYKR